MEEIKVDPFSQYEEVLCRDGIKRRIYPAKLKHKDFKFENLLSYTFNTTNNLR